MSSPVGEIRDLAEHAARNSGLPGLGNGPADAFRHIVGIAELRRRYGPLAARGIGDANEWRAEADGGSNVAAASRMDLHNNRIGETIGAQARTYDEVLTMARTAILDAKAEDGSGRGGTAMWLPRARWGANIRDADAPIEFAPAPAMEQVYRFGGAEHRHGASLSARERQAQLLEALAETPPELWTESDVRAVIASQPHAS